jgi:glycogen phosphorylase
METGSDNTIYSAVDSRKPDVRVGLDVDSIGQSMLDSLYFNVGKLREQANVNDWYTALAYAVRDRMINRYIKTLHFLADKNMKLVGYLSAEFLMGPHLGNSLVSLGIFGEAKEACRRLGLKIEDLIDAEVEPGLGNGGLGRLAACYLDSLATLEVAAIGYGIRYEFGIFEQRIIDGRQVEMTDKWLRSGNPWEICRPDIAYDVGLGGHTEVYHDGSGHRRVRWIPGMVVRGVAYDTPVPGYNCDVTILLRLWKAEAVESFDFQKFNTGEYYKAVEEKVTSETISKVLYPNDQPEIGKLLRLAQQYFFVSCSLQNMLHIHRLRRHDLNSFHETAAMQLNDTHPSIAVAELMRLLVDVHQMDWDEAWNITQCTFGYTNHTLLPEALEKWPLPLFSQTLPRHIEIIYEINRRFLDEVRLRTNGDEQRIVRMSLIDETGPRYVRMAHLAAVGSHAINGVAELHTELLKHDVMRDFYELYPEKFFNITNGVTPRRWLVMCNHNLADLISGRIDKKWISRLETHLKKIAEFADDPEFRAEWRKIKTANKRKLAVFIKRSTGTEVDTDTMFDVLVKRVHEYKRQGLKVLHIITLYNRIKRNPGLDITPRTFIFGGKAAPGYFMAKLIIKLINSVGDVVNRDPDVNSRLKVVFLPNYNVKLGQRVYPAADLSEQISTAGKEASGTGNMKFSLNGALTVGTLDGANVEIREEVGAENFFLFGLTAEQVYETKRRGYNPMDYYNSNEQLREAVDMPASGYFSGGDRELFRPFIDSLLQRDEYLLFADYQSYIDCQDEVDRVFRDREKWTTMSILNVAGMGKFSSDRAIREYCEKIWGFCKLEDIE